MQIDKNKFMAILIATILMLSIIATLVALPSANAHTPAWTIPTNSYVIASPNPVGVGQYVTLVVWVDQNPPTASGTSGPRWQGCKLDVTKPDGSKETIGPFTLRSATANDWVQYTPDQVGTYTFVFSWPGQTLANITGEGIRTTGIPYVGDFFAGSISEPLKLVVQQDPIVDWQEPPLPTDYWQTPINAANRGWSTLASNWLKGSWLVNDFQRWGSAPESPHIVWTKPMMPFLAGGINDASWPGIPSNVNDYESPWSAPIIMNGKIYYNAPPVSDVASYGYYCRDLYTGEIIWYKNGTDNGLNNPFTIGSGYNLGQSYLGLTQGQLYRYDSVNGQGVLAYLIMVSGSTWYFLDANGNFRLKLINVPSGTAVTDQDGSLLRFSYNAQTGKLLCWNSSQSIPPLAPTGTNQQQWKMRFGATIDAVNDTSWTNLGPSAGDDVNDIRPRSGYTMNLTIQTGLPGDIAVLQDENRVPKMIFGTYMFNRPGASADTGRGILGSDISGDTFSAWAMTIDEHVAPYSPYPGKTNTQNTNLGFGDTLLWYKNYTVPIPGKNYTWAIGGASYDDQIFVVSCKHTRQLWGYSLTTGEMLWGPTPSEGVMNYYNIVLAARPYYGKILSTGYAGTLYAYDAKTGKLLWTYNATSIGRESPYGENYPLSIGTVADGKVYLYSTEHSPTKPLWHGSYLRCINITDGTEIWKLLDYNQGMSIADGYIITSNQYDNNIYCIGKGQTAATVTAPDTVQPLGTSVLLKGSVTDQSPGAKGTPAIADADMQAWMEYLYEQQAMPTNAKGVEVTLDVIDPNGNFVHIGTVTSDIDSNYGYKFTPEVPGTYQIIATFAGSKAYGSSFATTYLSVDPAASTPIPAIALQSVADMYFVPAVAGIIVAIAIVGALLAILLLRKRP